MPRFFAASSGEIPEWAFSRIETYTPHSAKSANAVLPNAAAGAPTGIGHACTQKPRSSTYTRRIVTTERIRVTEMVDAISV